MKDVLGPIGLVAIMIKKTESSQWKPHTKKKCLETEQVYWETMKCQLKGKPIMLMKVYYWPFLGFSFASQNQQKTAEGKFFLPKFLL